MIYIYSRICTEYIKVLETGLPGTKGFNQPVRVDSKAIQEWAIDVMM